MVGTDTVLGVMSGTSLDGLDLCLVTFEKSGSKLQFEIKKSATFDLPDALVKKCSNLNISGSDLMQLDADFASFTADAINQFLNDKDKESLLCVASHGQTIFHQPQHGFTTQVGNGGIIAAKTGLTTCCDFRSQDVALSGNGAPLVPIGDAILFSEYDYCVNLGGFANVSFESGGKRVAYDICPVNFGLNRIANSIGLDYDENGRLARSGKIINTLLERLNNLPFYAQSGNKSLGAEWYQENIVPLLSQSYKPEDVLATLTEHAAVQIASQLKNGSCLVTGGGVYNEFLLERIEWHAKARIVVPEGQIVDFKEALIFGLLGYLRMRNETNVLSSSTGSTKDTISGAVYLGC